MKNIQIQGKSLKYDYGGSKGKQLYYFLLQKAKDPLWLSVILILVALFATVAISYKAILASAGLVALLIGVPLILLCMFNLKFGILTVLFLSFFILGILRFVDVPLGLIMDVLIAAMFFGLLVKKFRDRDWGFARNPVTTATLIWLAFSIFEVMNPWAPSRLAWLYTIRSMAGLMIIYFVALYAFDNRKYFSLFLKIWIGLALAGAFYGLYQEIIGLNQAELAWINSDPVRHKLLYIWGRYRKFSFFGNPTIFAILMAYTSLLCFILMAGKRPLWKKGLLAFAGLIMVWSMVYSGTRTAIAMIPVGFIFYAVLTLNKKTLLAGAVFFAIGAGIIFSPVQSLGPLNKNTLARIRSTFQLGEDPSFATRLENQEYIQPFIRSHPIGGGLGSTGIWGARFAPDSPLSKFPPDSGYVRVAVEMGWVGLILYLYLMFMILYVGVRNYFKVQDPSIKNYYAAILTAMYALAIANYAQQAIIMYPTMIIFYILMALVINLKRLDNHKTSMQ